MLLKEIGLKFENLISTNQHFPEAVMDLKDVRIVGTRETSFWRAMHLSFQPQTQCVILSDNIFVSLLSNTNIYLVFSNIDQQGNTRHRWDLLVLHRNNVLYFLFIHLSVMCMINSVSQSLKWNYFWVFFLKCSKFHVSKADGQCVLIPH